MIMLMEKNTEKEQEEHINVLELKTALFALQSLCTIVKDVHYQLRKSYVNHSFQCC